VTITARATEDSLRIVTFDLSNAMTIDSVRLGGIRLAFNHYPLFFEVQLNRAYAAGELMSLEIFYHGVPLGTGFGSFVFSSHAGVPWVWSLSEPYGARDWWPCKNHPLDKADSVDILITCDSRFKVGSNGRLLSVIDNGNNTRTHHWSGRYPIASYLVSITLTDFAEFSNWFHYSPQDSMEVLNYVLPEHLAQAQAALPGTVSMLRVFSDVFGLYPFINEKYGHSEFGLGGAMEHQTMTSTTTFAENTLSHELAHQWFGDLITCANWPNLWLNEGFATYSEALYLEAAYGIAAYRSHMEDKLESALRAQGTLYVEDTSSVQNLFNNNRVYSKGAAVLHMLRHILGDSVFFRSVRSYVADPRFRFGTATTEDLQEVFESVSGLSLDYFFRQWVYGENHPQYSMSWDAEQSAGGFVTTVQVFQTTRTNNPTFFIMPIDLRLSAGTRDTTFVVTPAFSGEAFSIHTPFMPDRVELDPDHWILGEMLPVNPAVPQSYSLNQNYPNPFNAGTVISFDVPRRAFIGLKVYNVIGEEVAVLVDGQVEPGPHTVRWDGIGSHGAHLPSGVYFCRLLGEGSSVARTMVILR
jgi:aminopeptidase N